MKYPHYEYIPNAMAQCVNSFRQIDPSILTHYLGDLIHDGMFVASQIPLNNTSFLWGLKNNGCGTHIAVDTKSNYELYKGTSIYFFRVIVKEITTDNIFLSKGYLYQLDVKIPYDSRYPYPYCLPDAAYISQRTQIEKGE